MAKIHYDIGNRSQMCRNAHDPRPGAHRPIVSTNVGQITCAKCLRHFSPEIVAAARAELQQMQNFGSSGGAR